MKRGFLPAGGYIFFHYYYSIKGLIYPLIENIFSFTTYNTRKAEIDGHFQKFPLCFLIQAEKENAKDKRKKSSKSFSRLTAFVPFSGGYSFVMGCLSIRNLNNAFNSVSVM